MHILQVLLDNYKGSIFFIYFSYFILINIKKIIFEKFFLKMTYYL